MSRMTKVLNRQIARRLLFQHKNYNYEMSFKKAQILFAMLVVAANLEQNKKNKLKRQLRQIVDKIEDNRLIDPNFILAPDQQLYREIHEMIVNDQKYDLDAELPANAALIFYILSAMLAIGQALGCATSVHKGAVAKLDSPIMAIILGANSGFANLFFILQAIKKLIPILALDIADSFNVGYCWVGAIMEMVADILALSSSGIGTSFAVKARNEMGIEFEGGIQSIATLIAFAIIYRDSVKSLFGIVSNKGSLSDHQISAQYKIKNTARFLLVSAAVIRVWEFSKIAKKVYGDDLNFDKVNDNLSEIAAYSSMPPMIALMGLSAWRCSDFFYNHGNKLYKKLRGYKEQIDVENNQLWSPQSTGNNNGKNYSKCFTPAILVSLAANGIGNVCLSDSLNYLILISIFLTSFALCAKSIFEKKETVKFDFSTYEKKIKELDSKPEQNMKALFWAIIAEEPKNTNKNQAPARLVMFAKRAITCARL